MENTVPVNPALLSIAKVVRTAEEVLLPIGLMTGEYAPLKRMFLGAGIGALLVSWLKPEFMFENNSTARSWKLLYPDDTNATWFPWHFIPILGAFMLGVLV